MDSRITTAVYDPAYPRRHPGCRLVTSFQKRRGPILPVPRQPRSTSTRFLAGGQRCSCAVIQRVTVQPVRPDSSRDAVQIRQSQRGPAPPPSTESAVAQNLSGGLVDKRTRGGFEARRESGRLFILTPVYFALFGIPAKNPQKTTGAR